MHPATWRYSLDAAAADRVAALDAALGLCLSDADLVGALLDPRGPLFQRLEFVGDSLLDVTAMLALLLREHWGDDRLADLTFDRQAMVSDRGLLRAARHARLPAVRGFGAGSHRLGDRIEACVGAAWVDAGVPAAVAVAERLVVDPALATEPILRVRPPRVGRPRDEDLAGRLERALGHTFGCEGWLEWALEAGPQRRRLAQLGDCAVEAAAACGLYELHPLASEGDLTVLRQEIGSNHRVAGVAARLGLRHPGRGPARHQRADRPARDAAHRRESDRAAADDVQALVGAVVMDAGPAAGVAAGRRLLGLPPEDLARRRAHRLLVGPVRTAGGAGTDEVSESGPAPGPASVPSPS